MRRKRGARRVIQVTAGGGGCLVRRLTALREQRPHACDLLAWPGMHLKE
jgi:hypothetical protein